METNEWLHMEIKALKKMLKLRSEEVRQLKAELKRCREGLEGLIVTQEQTL